MKIFSGILLHYELKQQDIFGRLVKIFGTPGLVTWKFYQEGSMLQSWVQ